MNGFMAPIGGVGIPKTMKPGESYEITLVDWDDVIDGDSVNLSLETSAGEEIGLGEFPVSDTVQGQVAVPGQTPDAPYWVRVSGKGFSELANFVYVGDMEYMRRQDTSVKYGWMRSPDTLVVNAGTCKMNPEVSFLEETDVAVRIMMRTDFYPFRQSFQECLTAKIVQLQEPLGDRVVLDMHTGRVVSVTPVAGASPASSQQEQAESTPTEVVPQAIRDAVSDAELQDLQAVAEQYGMTLQEAFDRYAWNDNFSRAVQRIREAAPESFAGAEIVDATNAWIAFTGNPPKSSARHNRCVHQNAQHRIRRGTHRPKDQRGGTRRGDPGRPLRRLQIARRAQCQHFVRQLRRARLCRLWCWKTRLPTRFLMICGPSRNNGSSK